MLKEEEEDSPRGVADLRESEATGEDCVSLTSTQSTTSTFFTKPPTYPMVPDMYLTLQWYCKQLRRGKGRPRESGDGYQLEAERGSTRTTTPGTAQLQAEEDLIRARILECSSRSICSLAVTHPCLRRGSVLWCAAGLVVPGSDYWSADGGSTVGQASRVILTEGTGFNTDFIRFHTTVTFFAPDGTRKASTALPASISSWLSLPKLSKSRPVRPFAFMPEEALPMHRWGEDSRQHHHHHHVSGAFEAVGLAPSGENAFAPYQGHSATYYVVQPPDMHGQRPTWRIRKLSHFTVTQVPGPKLVSKGVVDPLLGGSLVITPGATATDDVEEQAPPSVIDYRIDPLEDGDQEPEPGSPLVRVDMLNDQLVFLGIHRGRSVVREHHYEGIAVEPRFLEREFKWAAAERLRQQKNFITTNTLAGGDEASQYSGWTLREDAMHNHEAMNVTADDCARFFRTLPRGGIMTLMGRRGRHGGGMPLDDDAPRVEAAFRAEREGIDVLNGILDTRAGADWDEKARRKHRQVQERALLSVAKMTSRAGDVATMRALGRLGLCEAMAKALQHDVTVSKPKILVAVCWAIATLAYANENACRLGDLGVLPIICEQVERLVDSGFDGADLHYWGLCAVRNLCRQHANKVTLMRWGGLDLVRLLLLTSRSIARNTSIQRTGLMCLLEMAPLQKTHRDEMAVRIHHSQVAQLIAMVTMSFPHDDDMRRLCQLVASRLGLSERVDAVMPSVSDWYTAEEARAARKEKWWTRRWSVRKQMYEQALQEQDEEDERRRRLVQGHHRHVVREDGLSLGSRMA